MTGKLGQEPAFPFFTWNEVGHGNTITIEDPNTGRKIFLPFNEGMSKRFYAACAAMQGMLSHSTRYKPYKEDEHLHWHTALTKEAFHIADELLKQEKCINI